MFNLTIILLAISIMASLNAIADDRQPVIAVVVDANENLAELKFTSNELRLIYWRKQLYWPMGRRIKPVNLTAEHPLRSSSADAERMTVRPKINTTPRSTIQSEE